MRYTVEEIYSKKNKKEKQKKIIRIFVNAIIIPLLIYNIVILFQIVAFRDKSPNFLGYKIFIIGSGSMSPELEKEDVIITKQVMQEELKKGDIITFKQGDSIVTHQIQEIIEEKYQTKGIANINVDLQLVEFKQIEGKYIFKISKIGKIILFLRDKMGILVVAICVYIIYSNIKNKEEKIIERKEKRKKYEKEYKD